MDKFKFSVVIPIYNVEKYLEETILSVINQTIGFEENIQIILVNDGSKDNSEQICIKYRDKYPKNIQYIYQDNKGVSSARNKGLEYVQGKYINFLDSDDVWDYNVFEKVYDFFEIHKKEIDIVVCRQKLFEAQEGYHKLDYKFYENHIVDITEKYDEIQLSMSSAFIKSEVMKKYKFDTRLKYSEDATLIGEILMLKSKYGILADAIYNYRNRNENTSALQIREGNKSWYFDTIEYGYKLLINKSIEKYGSVIPYYQYHIMYDLQWRIRVDISIYLSKDEQEKYQNLMIELLSYIEDYIIFEQKYINKEYKILALCMKYKKDVRKELYYKDAKIFFNDIKIFSIKNNSLFKISKLNVINNKILKVEGIINCFLPQEDYDIFARTEDNKKIKIKNYRYIDEKDSIIGKLNYIREFSVDIPINTYLTDLRFIMNYKSNKKRLKLVFTQFSKLSNENNRLFFIQKDYIIYSEDNSIFIKKINKQEVKKVKKDYNKFLIEKGKYELIKLRKKAEKCKKQRNNIYIKFVGEDMYVMKTRQVWNDQLITTKKWKKVRNSLFFKRLYILSSKIIVGNQEQIKNIFSLDEEFIKDLYDFKLIYNDNQ